LNVLSKHIKNGNCSNISGTLSVDTTWQQVRQIPIIQDGPVVEQQFSKNSQERDIKFSFVMIVLNGMPFIEYSLKSVYDFAHEIIIVEGAVAECMFAANGDGSSKDGTVEFIKSFSDPANKIKFIQGRWPEKCEMQNEALKYVTGDYVWLIDSDEVYKKDDLEKIKDILKNEPSITQVNFIPDNFWKGMDYIFVSPRFSEPESHYRRLFKYVQGAYFTTHRPPTMVWADSDKTTEQMHLLDGTTTRRMGIIFYHYSYVLNKQVKQKIELYNKYNWGDKWGINLLEWYNECFLKWTPENREQIEARYPVWTGDRNSRTQLFTSTHPEVMENFKNKFEQKHCCSEEQALQVIGDTYYQKKVVEAWNLIEIDEPVIKRKNLMAQNIQQNKPFWNIHVALAFLADRLNPENYLEVGVRTGCSLVPLLHNSDVKEVVALDMWKESYAGLSNTKEYTVEQINKYKAKTNKQAKIEFIKGDSHKKLKDLISSGRKFDLITADGDHSESGAWEDLQDATKLLADKGAIVFDDIIHPSHSYLRKLVDRFQQEHSEYTVFINSKQDNGCAIFLKNIDPTKLLNEKPSEVPAKVTKGVKVAADYVPTGIKVGAESSFGAKIRDLFSKIRPKKIIETGTYLGTGTTTIITKSLQTLGIDDAMFFTIEVNPQNHARAKKYFETNNIKVNALNGLSVPRAMLPSREEISQKTITDVDYDGIFVDHKQENRVELYYSETDFPDVPDNLLYKCLKMFDFRPDFVLLDSGGHMGNIEFNCLIEHLQCPCYIALDDIYHIKHHKSFRQIQSDSRFELVTASKEKFGFCIAKFTPLPTFLKKDVENILWVRTDSIGDNVLAASMLPHIREKFRDAKITILCQEHIAQLYQACPYVDDIIVFNRKRALEDKQYREEIINRLRALKPELSLNSVFSREPITDVFAIECNAEERIAIEGNLTNISAELRDEHNQLYTRLLMSSGEHKLELERHRDFLKGLGINVRALQPIVWMTPEDEKFADSFFQKNNLNPDKTIALFAGAQYDVRLYEKYGTSLSEFCQKNQLKVVALGTEQERDVNQRNLDTIGVETVNLSGRTTIRQSAAILKRCRLAVGAETGLAHISCAVRTPNVILLGGGHFGRFMPYSPLTSIVCLPLDCFGCGWRCKYEKPHCVRDVSPRVITEAIRQNLAKRPEKPRVFVQAALMPNSAATRPKWKPFDKFLDTGKVEIVTIGRTLRIYKGHPPATGTNVRRSIGRRGADRYPKISIVTPSYNQKDYLEECICSVLDQGYPNLEYIIMDGGSTDGSVKIIKKYAKYLAYWQSGPDGGQYAAINEGFKRTTGEIMTWLNSDDKFHPDAFRIVASIFIYRKDVEWIMGHPNTFNEQGQQSWIANARPLWSREKYLKKEYKFIQQEGTFWRRSLWEKAGATLQTDLELAGDLELWARFFRFTQLYNIDALIAGYRYHLGQKAQLFMDKYIREAEKVLDREILLFREGKNKELLSAPEPITISEIRKYLFLISCEVSDNAKEINRQGEDLLAKGDFEGALNAFTKAIEIAPNFIAAHSNVGRLYLQKGQPAMALKHFTKALKINAYDRATVLNCGQILASHGKIEDARKLYWSYLEENPNDKEIVNALTKLKKGRTVEIHDDKYLVSAIVSIYNSERFIRGCLEDLENQTIAEKLDIIVINSGSQENEEAIVREYQQKHNNIVYIKTEQREGIYTAWNRAIKVARGTFLTNANTDDRHREDALEIMSETLLTNPDVALVYGDQICTDTPNGTFANHHAIEMAKRPEYSQERLLFGCCVGSQPMWRKSLHTELGYFDDTLTCAGDWDFWLRISSKYKFKHIPEFLGLYYHNEDGIEHGKKIHSLYERYKVGKRYGNPYISVIPLYTSKDNPLVSVIMPAYNAAEHIAEAIESVLIQNYRNFELIVVDDGSTDNTRDIVAGFKDDNIRYFYKENAGPASARNLGITKSQGLSLIHLDSDDMITPDYIAKHLQEFEKHPDADLVYCDDCLIEENSNPIRVIERPEYTDRRLLIRDLFHCGFPVVPFRTCIRRNVFDKIGFFDEELLVGEDYDMMRRFVKHGLKIHHLKGALYLRRMTSNSLSRNCSAQKAKSHFDVVKRFTDTFTYDELFPGIEWDKIAPEIRQLHAKCLTAGTYLAIGQEYVKTNATEYSRTAFDRACSELNDCVKMDPENQGLRQLLQKSKIIRARYTEAPQQVVSK